MNTINIVMRGDLDTDFAVGTALFIFAFVAAFSYINYSYSERMSHELDENSKLKIEGIYQNLPWASVEKRIVLVEGYSENEFVNLSDYCVDLILDEYGRSVCFDSSLDGFAAKISGSGKFSLYCLADSAERIEHNFCSLSLASLNDLAEEKVSSPIYLKMLVSGPKVNSSGGFCENRLVNIISGSGIEEKYLNICI